jgi:hypothetical protein
VSGAIDFSEVTDPEVLARLLEVSRLLMSDTESVISGEGIEVGFLGSLLKAATSIIPGGGFIRGGMDVLSALTKGKKKAPPPAPGVEHHPGGGVSAAVPLASGGNPMTLYYHPSGSVGPVVMRF